MSVTVECPRHGFPRSREEAERTPGAIYYVEQCSHFENRFIVTLRRVDDSPFGCVDYVEDLGGGEVRVESRGVKSREECIRAWHDLHVKMLDGVPPEEET